MTLPRFLIIGAMKAGTTALYRDLATNPGVYFPIDKELPDRGLDSDAVLTPPGLRDYENHFNAARPNQIVGDASTTYSKLPDIRGVPERAMRVLGRELRIIYLVREPIARIMSHHYHLFGYGLAAQSVDSEVRERAQYVAYSSYAMQLRGWLDAFGPERILTIPFESYTTQRQEWISRVSTFIGADPRPELVQTDKVYNRGEDRPAPRGIGMWVRERALYQNLVRPLLPADVRRSLFRLLSPPAPPRPDPPRLETVDYLVERLRADVDELQHLLGAGEPLWDLQKVREKYAARVSGPVT